MANFSPLVLNAGQSQQLQSSDTLLVANFAATTQTVCPLIYGSSASGGNLQLTSTSHATKGFIYLGTGVGYDGTKAFLGIGTQSPAALLHLAGNISAAAWTTSGIGIRDAAATYTDTTSATGTVPAIYGNYYGVKTFNSTNASVVVTNLYANYYEAPIVTGNVIATNTFVAGYGGNVKFAGATGLLSFSNNCLIQVTSSNAFTVQQSGVTKYMIALTTGNHSFSNQVATTGTTAFINFTQSANTGGSGGGLIFTAGAHTGQTTATEITDINYNLSAAMTLVDGTVGNMRAARFQGRTYNKTTTLVTLTKASTLSVSSPIAGTGVTITTNAAIECDGNLLLPTAGNGLYIKQGANATCGRGTLVGGTLTVSTTKATSTCEIFLTDRGGTVTNLGTIYISSVSSGTSFTVTSSNILDVSTFSWFIVEAAP